MDTGYKNTFFIPKYFSAYLILKLVKLNFQTDSWLFATGYPITSGKKKKRVASEKESTRVCQSLM